MRLDRQGTLHKLGEALPTTLPGGWAFDGASITLDEDGRPFRQLARWKRPIPGDSMWRDSDQRLTLDSELEEASPADVERLGRFLGLPVDGTSEPERKALVQLELSRSISTTPESVESTEPVDSPLP